MLPDGGRRTWRLQYGDEKNENNTRKEKEALYSVEDWTGGSDIGLLLSLPQHTCLAYKIAC